MRSFVLRKEKSITSENTHSHATCHFLGKLFLQHTLYSAFNCSSCDGEHRLAFIFVRFKGSFESFKQSSLTCNWMLEKYWPTCSSVRLWSRKNYSVSVKKRQWSLTRRFCSSWNEQAQLIRRSRETNRSLLSWRKRDFDPTLVCCLWLLTEERLWRVLNICYFAEKREEEFTGRKEKAVCITDEKPGKPMGPLSPFTPLPWSPFSPYDKYH